MVLNLKSKLFVIILIINGLTVMAWAESGLSINVTTATGDIKAVNIGERSLFVINDGDLLQTEGLPQLPYKIIRVALPEGTVLNEIKAAGRQINNFATQMNYPWFEGDIKTDGGEEAYSPAIKNRKIYDADNLYPGKYYEILSEGSLGPQPIITLAIYPIQLKPVSGELILVGEISLDITTIAKAATQRLEKSSESGMLRAMVTNPDQLSNDGGMPPILRGRIPGTGVLGIGAEYLIITSGELAPAFYPYLVWKNQKGLLTEMVLIEDILASYTGLDNAERLRLYLL
jgi:hypothetical protein